MKTKKAVALASFLTLGLLFFLVAGIFLMTGLITRTEVGGHRVAVIEIYGPIANTGSFDFLGGRRATAEEIIPLIQKVNKNPQYKALLLKIDSPGGSAAGSQSIFQELMRFKKETGKPVIASLGDTATSGGYYIASAADYIMASPATLTGSIGVIIETGNFQGLYEMLGIEYEVITGGEFKDLGHHGRALTPEERNILQNLITEIYEQFIAAVVEGRGLEESIIRELATGEIFSGSQALKLQLVDELGNFQDAITVAAEMAGLTDPVVETISRERYGFFSPLFQLWSQFSILHAPLAIYPRPNPLENIQIRY